MIKVLRIWLIGLLLAAPLLFAEESAKPVAPQSGPAWWEKTLWYVPNRVMDLLDVFRLRVKVGPGLGVGARFTDAFSLYAGEEYSFYVGLPGPRQRPVLPSLAGYEEKRGLVILGLDASDDMPHPPRYEFSEVGASAHLLFVGVDAGLSVAELADFFRGWIGGDPSGDDFPRAEKPDPLPPGGVLRPLPMDFSFPVEAKPESFIGLHHRLDYLQANVPLMLQGHMHDLDRSLTAPEYILEDQPPVTNLRLSLFVEYISGPKESFSVDPDIKIKVELPNLENSLSLFIQSSYDEELPGTDIVDREDKGWSVGAKQQAKKWNITSSVGIHTKWPPEIFWRTAWKPRWFWGEWRYDFEYRIFWENEDGFGMYNQLQLMRWFGEQPHLVFKSLTAGKYSESTRGYEWQQSFMLCHVPHLKYEAKRGRNVGVHDVLTGMALTGNIFGGDEQMEKYRSTVVFRRSVYKEFVVLQFEPGLEWRDENDWATQYRVDAGVVLLF